jgi:hypothetical protein
VKGETTGEGKKEAIEQQVDLMADLGWPVLQLWEARQWKGMVGRLGSIEDYDAIGIEMKMTIQFSHHVGTGYELAVSLAGPEKVERWLSITEISTFQGLDRNTMRLITSSVVQAFPAFPAEAKIESEALDVVEWVCCREGEGEVGEEPKAHLCKPEVKAVCAGSEKVVDLLPKPWAVAWMGEMVAGENAGKEKEKEEIPILEGTVGTLPIRGVRSAKWWDQ